MTNPMGWPCERGHKFWMRHAYSTRVNPDSTGLEQVCVHCGHIKPIERKDNMNREEDLFGDYPYKILSVKVGGWKGKYEGGYISKESAVGTADRMQREDSGRLFCVAHVIHQPKPKETIVDLDDKTYIIERGATSTSIIAPCGQTQIFNNEELKKLLKGE